MILAPTRANNVPQICLLSCSLFALMFLAPAAKSQIRSSDIDSDPSSGLRRGTNTIEGQVFDSSGRPLIKRCTVRLSSVNVGEFSTMTNDSGLFTFRRLKEGKYYLQIDAGEDYQPAAETVDFFDNRNGINHVQIQLRPKPTAANNKPAVLNAALANVPKPALEFYQQGMQLADAGKPREAIESFKSAVSLYPQFVMALNEMSAIYINLAELEPATDALQAALKIEPNNPTLRLNYGYVLMLKERFVDSERELSRAIQLRDELVAAHLYRGRVLIRLRNYDEAEKELNRTLSLGGASGIVAYRYLGALYSEKGETSKAIAALENYLKLTPRAKDSEQVRGIIRQLQDEAANKKN
jgi:tetratricopeptide (TPR) repeat protein